MLDADGRVEVIRRYAEPYSVLVETGTADGYTTKSLVEDFDRLITIELDASRYLHVALSEFLGRPKVLPLQGDSVVVLEKVLHRLAQDETSVLLWLDAHWSGGPRCPQVTPIVEELALVSYYAFPKLVLIDDARLFGEDPAYPSLQWVEGYAVGNGFELEVTDDIIRMVPLEQDDAAPG